MPFIMDGTMVYFDSRVPTAWEIENCKNIQMTDDSAWDPATVTIAGITTKPGLPLAEIVERRELARRMYRSLGRKIDTRT